MSQANSLAALTALDLDKLVAVNSKKQSWRAVVIKVVAALMRCFCKLEIDENFAKYFNNDEQAAIIIANHQSFFDVPAIIIATPLWIDWLCKQELFQIPLFKTFLLHWAAIPFRRESTDLRAVKSILQRLKAKRIVGIFPQGHRCKNKKELLAYQASGAIINLARKTKAHIHLVAVEGEFKWGHTVKLHTKKPFLLSERFAQESDDDKIAYSLMQEVYEMAHRNYPTYAEMQAFAQEQTSKG